MTRSFPRLLYIDGFAGPGQYEAGEPGSPVIALRAAIFNTALQRKPPPCNLIFLFIEERLDRAQRLRGELTKLTATQPLPDWVKYLVEEGEFEGALAQKFDELTRNGTTPTFAFIDPFGYSGLPMSLIARIARIPHSECLINFAFQSINRWGGYGDPQKDRHIDALYGGPDWRPRQGNEQAMVDFYGESLATKAGFKYVTTFKMKDNVDRTEYFLAFGTNDPKGLSVMKQAMWKADPQEGRIFSDASDPNQLILVAGLIPLRDLLRDRFAGKGWVSMDEIIEYVRHTPYSEEMHLKKRTLVPMEREVPRVIEVGRPEGKKRGTFTEGTRVRFC